MKEYEKNNSNMILFENKCSWNFRNTCTTPLYLRLNRYERVAKDTDNAIILKR